MAILEVNKIFKAYRKVLAVDNVSFKLNSSSVSVIIGPNGSGKSTTIKSIAGLLNFQGEILVDGFDNRSLDAKKLLAYVAETPDVFPMLTVLEHIYYILKAYDLEVDREEIDYYLKKFDLYDKKDKLGNQLSKGMMQKLSLICGLIIKPKVLLLDEPMIGLDPKAIRELKKTILDLKNKGMAILISTHMLEMVEDLWDNMILLKEGKIIGQYDRRDMGGQELEELFFDLTGDKDDE